MTSNRVFVSPGVYTSENDLTFVTNNVGVTSLGLVGETTKGPAFQPIYISNYAEMRKFFGGLNAEKIKDNGSLRYELPYIAKSYLTNSNQLYVTRVLGLSGYNAGKSWGLAVDGKLVALLRSRGKYVANEELEFACDTLTISDTPTNGEDFTLTTNNAEDDTKEYKVSLDKTKNNYITRVLGKTNQDAKSQIFVEEIYPNFIDSLDDMLDVTLVDYETKFANYKTRYKSAMTPFVVSELKGNEVSKLFRFETISDGNTANEDVKISITNIKPDDREFDVVVRKFGDTDANPAQLERFSKCTMDPTSNNYIAKRVGTTNGDYLAISSYVLVEMADDEPNTDSYPAGFEGYPIRETKANNDDDTTAPEMTYKTEYSEFENKRRVFLGTTTNVDSDMLSYNGLNADGSTSGILTKGFHMDSEADPNEFIVGTSSFKSDSDTVGTPYEKVYSRKFTLNPCGGFDGWDIYRTRRTNTDNYTIQKLKSDPGTEDLFSPLALSNGDSGVNSDYYAFFEGIRTFSNPESVNINVFCTPGVDTFDNTNLVEDTIDMIERERSDSLYIVATPDVSEGDKMTAQDVASRLYQQFDSSYTATYWPWIQKNDDENNVLVYMPPTAEVVKNIALTDNISFPWFATAGYQRGNVTALQARKKLTQPEREILYAERINPIVTFSGDGIKIMGNKNLQVKNSPLNRINVRRLLLRARKLISAVSIRLLFEQNDDKLRGEFLRKVNPILENIRKERGLTNFKVKLDPTPEGNDRNTLSGKIRIQPTNALEYVDIGFDVTDSGASFDDV